MHATLPLTAPHPTSVMHKRPYIFLAVISAPLAVAFSPNPSLRKRFSNPTRFFPSPLGVESGGDRGGEGNFFDDGGSADPSPASLNDSSPEIDEVAFASDFEEHIPRMNSVTLVGRVGNDPEPRYFDDGKVVLNLSLAVKRKIHPLERKVRNIKYGEEGTDWYPLELWGRDAEFASKYVTKGARIGISGSLGMDSWQDRSTGDQRTKHKVLVKHLDILETKAEAGLRKGGVSGGFGGGYESGSQKGKYYQGGAGAGGGSSGELDNDDEDGGPSPAGSGGFFD